MESAQITRTLQIAAAARIARTSRNARMPHTATSTRKIVWLRLLEDLNRTATSNRKIVRTCVDTRETGKEMRTPDPKGAEARNLKCENATYGEQ